MSNSFKSIFTIILALFFINTNYSQEKKENPLDKIDLEGLTKKLNELDFNKPVIAPRERKIDKLLKYGLCEYGYFFDSDSKNYEANLKFIKDSLKLFQTIAIARQSIILSNHKKCHTWALPYFSLQEQKQLLAKQGEYHRKLGQEIARDKLEKQRKAEAEKNKANQERYAQQRAEKEKQRQKNVQGLVDLIGVISKEVKNPRSTSSSNLPATDFDAYKSCSEAGNTRCYETLGLMYAYGKGTKRDFSEGKYWLKKAGFHMCPTCWGDGDQECDKCKGTGKNYYDSGRENGECRANCNYGKVDCHRCNGIGVVDPDE